MKQTVLFLALVCSCSSTAAAQSLRELSRRPIDAAQLSTPSSPATYAHEEQDALDMATWFYVSTAAADWSVTAVCAKVLCGDRTLTGFLYGVEDARAAIPLGLALDALLVVGIRELVAPDHPKMARALLYGLGGARLTFVTAKVVDLRRDVRRVP